MWPCGFKGSPYINNCGYDAAFGLLHHLWPDVSRALPGTAVSFVLMAYSYSSIPPFSGWFGLFRALAIVVAIEQVNLGLLTLSD